MSVFKRRRDEDDNQPAAVSPPRQRDIEAGMASHPPTRPAPPSPARVPPHVERALITLTSKMQSLVERLDAIERRVDELTEVSANTPSHSDLLEVRLHSAKLAAELARATVELRGEIGIASDETRRAVRETVATVTEHETVQQQEFEEEPQIDESLGNVQTIDLTETQAQEHNDKEKSNRYTA